MVRIDGLETRFRKSGARGREVTYMKVPSSVSFWLPVDIESIYDMSFTEENAVITIVLTRQIKVNKRGKNVKQ